MSVCVTAGLLRRRGSTSPRRSSPHSEVNVKIVGRRKHLSCTAGWCKTGLTIAKNGKGGALRLRLAVGGSRLTSDLGQILEHAIARVGASANMRSVKADACAADSAVRLFLRGMTQHNRCSLRLLPHDNLSMSDTPPTLGLCCYKNRAVVVNRCDLCKAEYACPEFKSKAAVMQFNAMIPPSMLLAPLPIELWPSICAEVAPDASAQSTHSDSNGSTESPVCRLVSTLINADPHSI